MAEFLVICQTNVGQLKANYNGKQNYGQAGQSRRGVLKLSLGKCWQNCDK